MLEKELAAEKNEIGESGRRLAEVGKRFEQADKAKVPSPALGK